MDLKNVLNENEVKEDITEKPELVRKHKKPVQLRDIESRSATNRKITQENFETDENIRSLLEKEKEEIYKQSWNKLDNGMKINRLKVFVKQEVEKNNLTSDERISLMKLLLNACRQNKLNRNSDVIYDKETCLIKEIKVLRYENQKYNLELNEIKKPKQTNKSKSNIERLLKSKH